MRNVSVVFLFAATLNLSGCITPDPVDSIGPSGGIRQEVREKIALCSAGYGFTLSSSLEGKVGDNILKDGVSVTAGIEEELRGYYLGKVGQSGEEGNALFQTYVGCLERITV